MFNKIDIGQLTNITAASGTTPAKPQNEVKLGGFGYGYGTMANVGIEKENRVPTWLTEQFASISGDKAERPDGTNLVIKGALMPDGVEETCEV